MDKPNEIAELTQAIISLTNKISGLTFAAVGCVFLSYFVMWLFIRHYDSRTGQVGSGFVDARAAILFDEGKIDDLIRYCKKWIEKYPNRTSINWFLALAYFNRGDYRAALTFFEKVKTLDRNLKSQVQAYVEEIESSFSASSVKQ